MGWVGGWVGGLKGGGRDISRTRPEPRLESLEAGPANHPRRACLSARLRRTVRDRRARKQRVVPPIQTGPWRTVGRIGPPCRAAGESRAARRMPRAAGRSRAEQPERLPARRPAHTGQVIPAARSSRPEGCKGRGSGASDRERICGGEDPKP